MLLFVVTLGIGLRYIIVTTSSSVATAQQVLSENCYQWRLGYCATSGKETVWELCRETMWELCGKYHVIAGINPHDRVWINPTA